MNTIMINSVNKDATMPDGNPFKFYTLSEVKMYGSEPTVIPVGFSFDVPSSQTLLVDSLRPDLIVLDFINIKSANELCIVVQAVEYVQVDLEKGEAFAIGRVVETPLVKLRFAIFSEDNKRKIYGGVAKIENSNPKTDK